jgi:hypothetical protein
MEKPGVFYNAEIRNNGTARRISETLLRMGFGETGMVRYNRPVLQPGDHDFWLFVDDGRDEIPMEVPEGVPSACYLVDVHLGYDIRLEWARKFDYVFLAQLPAVEKMKKDGVENVHWLPLACLPCVDPSREELKVLPKERLGQWGLEKKHDAVFVGFLNNGWEGGGNSRVEYLDKVFAAHPDSWFSFNCFFEEAAIHYARGRVGFNISITNDLNMRFFETMSYGTCLVTNTDVHGIEELGFEDGKHFVGYKGVDDAVEKVGWCLDNPMERESIAEAGHELAREKHTYECRINEMLKIVGV